jgi:DNA-binding phage protein
MRLKDFCETFKDDLTDPEFVIGYLEDALEVGGVSLFIEALEDVVRVYPKQALTEAWLS